MGPFAKHALVFAALALGGCAGAQPSPQAAPVARIASRNADVGVQASSTARTYSLATSGSSIDTGGAVILVDAPLAKVLEVVTDYASYHDVLPRIEESRIVGKRGGSTDVYLRAPVLGGVAHVWGIARFSPARRMVDGGRRIEGLLVKGNLKAFHGVWTLVPDGAGSTVVHLELFAEVDLPIPADMVTPELMWAAGKGVTAIRERAMGATPAARE
jgi:ribosome-associated toxin RatA of RatAB toxin-antitoxin module